MEPKFNNPKSNEERYNEFLVHSAHGIAIMYGAELLASGLRDSFFSDTEIHPFNGRISTGQRRKYSWTEMSRKSPEGFKVIQLRNALNLAHITLDRGALVNHFFTFSGIQSEATRILLTDLLIARIAVNKDPNADQNENFINMHEFIMGNKFLEEENKIYKEMEVDKMNRADIVNFKTEDILLSVLKGSLKLNSNPNAVDSFEDYHYFIWPKGIK